MEACIDQEWAVVGSPASESNAEESTMTGKTTEDARHAWVPIASLVLLSLGVGGGAVYAVHNEFTGVNQRISAVDAHVARVEMAVRIVGAKQGGDTQTLIDEALRTC
jgi:endonuclease III